jgi:hypothetical protein
VATLETMTELPNTCLQVPVDPAGLVTLMADLHCLQCRAILREWQVQTGKVCL